MHLLKPTAFICAAVVLAPPLLAQNMPQTEDSFTLETAPVKVTFTLQCVFKTECFEGEACAETNFGAQLNVVAGGLTETDMVVQSDLVSDAGDATLLGVRSGKAMSLAGGGFDARHLLTIAQDGAARYTVHYADGPMFINYLGACK